MKTLKIFSFLSFFLAIASISFAQQTKTETIAVSGNCGMCKTNIEKAAKKAGATDAEWNVEEKMLTVKYNSASTNTAKIQQAIAAVGYDTKDVKASDAAYDKLHACCKYERTKKDEVGQASSKKEKADCCAKEGSSKDAKAACCN